MSIVCGIKGLFGNLIINFSGDGWIVFGVEWKVVEFKVNVGR